MTSITPRIQYNSANPCYNQNCTNINHCKMPPIGSLDELISHLRVAFESDHVNIEHVQALMASYKSNPKDWKKFAKFDPYRYTRNLVDEGNGKYNLMLLCWGEGHGSAIHDHADAHCFMKILHGSLSEIRFAWPTQNEEESEEGENSSEESMRAMQEISRNSLKTNEVCYMSDQLGLHRVENSSHTEPAVSLHIYSPPFSQCSMFDQRTGHRTKVNVTFWSKFGEKVSYDTNKQNNTTDSENN